MLHKKTRDGGMTFNLGTVELMAAKSPGGYTSDVPGLGKVTVKIKVDETPKKKRAW